MSRQELRRVEVISRVQSEGLPLRDAAKMLALSYRQTKRLWRRYRLEGASGLQHGSAGRESHRAKPRAFREQVLRLLREKYSGGPEEPRFGPTLAAQHLAEEDGCPSMKKRCGAGCWKKNSGCAHAGFRLESERWVSNDWVVRYHTRYLQLQPTRGQRRSRRAKAVLYESEAGDLQVCYRGETMAFTELSGPLRDPEAEQEATVHVRCWQRYRRPGADHPCKRQVVNNIQRVRRRLLEEAVAARRSGKGACVPPGAAENAAPSCTPAPLPEPSSDLHKGDTFIELNQGTF